ncbi:MAG: hypothetical protein M5U12_36415 [Verrucomicrobia bacterium]|nr:hypothetical protein [Verrucomicrobiota bacterium]
MPRKTDSNSPADWLWLADSDLQGVQSLAREELAYPLCRSKLAEVVEKILKAEPSDWTGFSRRPTTSSACSGS